MTNTLLSKFDDEMSKPHTDTEDRIHNWLVDNQDDQELMDGLKKDLEPKRTINGAMQYAIYKASQMITGPRQRATGTMVDDSVAYTWFKEYFTNPRSQGCPRFQSGEELANSVGKINA